MNHELIKKYKNHKNQSIYILHYPKGEKSCVSYGYDLIKEESNFIFKCDINSDFYGTYILNLSANKIIGINKGINLNKKFSKGTFLNYNKMLYFNLKNSYNIILKKNEQIDSIDIMNEIGI